MEYIGGISEFNYSPIQDFNKALKENDANLKKTTWINSWIG